MTTTAAIPTAPHTNEAERQADREAFAACGLGGMTIEAQENGAWRCARNAYEASAGYEQQHWIERAYRHSVSASMLRGFAVPRVPLALVETDLGVSYAHVGCENAVEHPRFTEPVCRCQYVHAYGFQAFDVGLFVNVKGAEYLAPRSGR